MSGPALPLIGGGGGGGGFGITFTVPAQTKATQVTVPAAGPPPASPVAVTRATTAVPVPAGPHSLAFTGAAVLAALLLAAVVIAVGTALVRLSKRQGPAAAAGS